MKQKQTGVLAYGLKRLIADINAVHPARSDLEEKAACFLAALLDALENGGAADIAARHERLYRFWLESVPWCAELSRAIEKILIAYSATLQRGKEPQ